MDEPGIEVFISSASEDYPSATEVFRHLSSLGIRCFFSEDTLDRLGQTQYKQVIESAIEQCRHLTARARRGASRTMRRRPVSPSAWAGR